MKNQEFIGKGIKNLVKGSPNANVINILRSIIEDENCICYIPFDYANQSIELTEKDKQIAYSEFALSDNKDYDDEDYELGGYEL